MLFYIACAFIMKQDAVYNVSLTKFAHSFTGDKSTSETMEFQ